MNTLATRSSARMTGLTFSIVATLLVALGPLADLCSRFGLSWKDAMEIATLLTSGAIWLIGVYWPWLLPFLATLRGLLAVFGTSAVVGF